MANVVAVQVLEDGTRNVVAKIDVDADTSDVANTVILDPQTLYQGLPPTDELAVFEIQYSIEDGWYVSLWWDATVPVKIVDLNGRGWFHFEEYGGVTNNAGTGVNGKILLSTTGWLSGTMTATIILHCIKSYVGLGLGVNALIQLNGLGYIDQLSGGKILVH